MLFDYILSDGVADLANAAWVDDAGEGAVWRSVCENWALRLEVGGKFYREAGFAKEFEALPRRVHGVEEIALGEQRDCGLFR